MSAVSSLGRKPWGLKWRSSAWFVTLVVGYGIATDLLIYSIIIPVVPFQLEHLGYTHVSGLSGWLLFAYSAGLVLSTPPIAIWSEKYNTRRMPLLFGLVALMGSSVMFMEAPKYWVMILARILQGISSSMVWVAGLALLCDTIPEQNIGQQLGLAMAGLTVGLVMAPPVGGALYAHFGFRAPFIFGIACAAVDGIGRLLVIERRDALKWGHDPTVTLDPSPESAEDPPATSDTTVQDNPTATDSDVDRPGVKEEFQVQETVSSDPHLEPGPSSKPILTPLGVIVSMSKSSRALAAIFITFIFGVAFTALEPTLPLRLQAVWNFNSSKVGLIYIASAAPSIISAPLTGWYSDRHGMEWVTLLCLLLSLPWWCLLVIRGHLVLFIASVALLSFFMSGIVSPLMAELASVARTLPGVGYAHVYGAFNLAYGVGSAVGPIMGGQVYDHLRLGWVAVCSLIAGLVFIASVVSFCLTGERPLAARIVSRSGRRPSRESGHVNA